jgi:hypothetical protein
VRTLKGHKVEATMLSIRLTVLLTLVALLVIPSINANPIPLVPGEHVDSIRRSIDDPFNPQPDPPGKVVERYAEPEDFNPQPDPPVVT